MRKKSEKDCRLLVDIAVEPLVADPFMSFGQLEEIPETHSELLESFRLLLLLEGGGRSEGGGRRRRPSSAPNSTRSSFTFTLLRQLLHFNISLITHSILYTP